MKDTRKFKMYTPAGNKLENKVAAIIRRSQKALSGFNIHTDKAELEESLKESALQSITSIIQRSFLVIEE